jgi:hypothetical protein
MSIVYTIYKVLSKDQCFIFILVHWNYDCCASLIIIIIIVHHKLFLLYRL